MQTKTERKTERERRKTGREERGSDEEKKRIAANEAVRDKTM